MSTVFLAPLDSPDADAAAAAVPALWERADFAQVFAANDRPALKLHVGEPGCTTHVPPAIVAELVRLIRATGADPFLTDTAVLYRGPRNNGVGHARVAHEHGFTMAGVGAPFIPADGLDGDEDREVDVGGKHFERVAVASAILHARSLLVLSHATGHLGTGLAATLKNLGMGCSSKRAKLRQHHGQQPRIAEDRCTACCVCAQWCPADAIVVADVASIDSVACIGCGECVAVCQDGAVEFDWAIAGRELQERVVEHAAAVVRSKPGRIAYVTVALNITRDCDCLGVAAPPAVPHIGLLASRDPVALDQAVLDLVQRTAGDSLEARTYPQHDASVQVRYAEALGLGSSTYDLVTIGG